METTNKTVITVNVIVDAPIERVWKSFTTPEDIVKWNHASNDWHTTKAKNDLQVGGHFSYRMEAKDGSMGFDFRGTYEIVIVCRQIDYLMDDGRKAKVIFSTVGNKTEVVESFEAESINPIELQRLGWQAILDNFKKYTEETGHQNSWLYI